MDARQCSKHSTYFNSFNPHNKGLLLTSALSGSSASTVTECHMTGFFVTFSCHLLRKILPYCLWKKSSINPIPILSQDPVPFLYSHCLYLKLSDLSLAGWFSWLEHCPIHQKIVGLIPVQGICLGCRFDPRLGQVQEATNRCFSHTDMCVCVSLSFSLSLSQIDENIFLDEDQKINKIFWLGVLLPSSLP